MPLRYDNQGLEIQNLAEVLTEREDACKLFLGNDFKISGDSVAANLQASDADREALIQELLAFLVNQMSVSNSSGIFLDWNAMFKNLSRITPRQTTITRTINGTAGTVLAVNSLSITDTTIDEQFTLSSAVTIGAGGTVQGTFISSSYGELNVSDSDTFEIVTPISGVTSVTFTTGDSTITAGRNAETDTIFRSRVVNSNQINSIGISQGIIDKILQLDGVESASYIENKSSTQYTYDTEDYTAGTGNITIADTSFFISGSTGSLFSTELDANYKLIWTADNTDTQEGIVLTITDDNNLTLKESANTNTLTPASFQYAPPRLPPNSFEIIVIGGNDADIAQTILDNMIPTASTYGNTSANATDSEGVTEAISFTRPTQITIEMAMDVYYTSALSVEEQLALKQACVDYWDELKSSHSQKGVGLNMDGDDFAQLSNTNSKIRKIRNIVINRHGESAPADNYIEIYKREIANLSTDNITLTLHSV